MCVSRQFYPLFKLWNGKKKVLLSQPKIIENRDFVSFDEEIKDWNFAINKNPLAKESSKLIIKNNPDFVECLKYINVPCGKCEECLKSRARGWAFRILKEAEQYENNYFITFTYDDEHLPVKPIFNMQTGEFKTYASTLIKSEISDFNKKLKTYLKRKGFKSDFRFYGIGEYGDNTHRAHYHVIYFNLDLPNDLQFYKYDNGNIYFTSEFLNSIWNRGFVVVGALDIGSACYVARYCDKKQQRSDAEKFIISSYEIQPEFSVMSRRPGIGSYYLDKIEDNIKNGVYTLSCRGNDFSIPIYYSKKLKEIMDPNDLVYYEMRNNMLIKNNFNRDLLLSDILSTGSLQSYLLAEDAYKKSCKKVRDNIKL